MMLTIKQIMYGFGALLISSSALAFEHTEVCNHVFQSVSQDTGRYDIVTPGEIRSVITTEAPIYAAIGRDFTISARKGFFCSDLLDPMAIINCGWEYTNGGSGEYAWYEARGGFPSFLGGFNSSRRLDYVPTVRGNHKVAVAAIDKYHTIPSPDGYDGKITMCDTVDVIAHNPPTINAQVAALAPSIQGSANATIDSLSKRGSEGKEPLVTWYIRSMQQPDVEYNLEGQELNFSPFYSGTYTIVVMVSDGVHLASQLFTDILVTDGADPCATTHLCDVIR